jgi:hypothetical protein
MTPASQWQELLRIVNSDNAIIMKATIAMVMTAKMPAH